MGTEDFVATSGLYWASALVTAVIDLAFVALLAWRVQPERFRQLKWPLLGASLIFWISLWTSVVCWCWDWCYRYVFPSWGHWVIPPVYGLIFGAMGLAFWWLALHLPGNPVATFCILGGLQSLPGHLWAIYGVRMLDKVPILRAVSPSSALVFGVFEFVFYWGVIVIIALVVVRVRDWRRRQAQVRARI